MPEKLDPRQTLAYLYNPPKKPALVEVPPLNYLMLDGHGDPNQNPLYQETVEALMSVAYTIKFACKKQSGLDYSVMPLEGLWWVPDMTRFSINDKSSWDWTMMVMQPEWITPEIVAAAQTEAARKKGLARISEIRFETYREETAAQIMYVGAYADEGPVIADLHAFIAAQGYCLHGKHHEIYLGDPRRTAPEKLKTVIRQPATRPNPA